MYVRNIYMRTQILHLRRYTTIDESMKGQVDTQWWEYEGTSGYTM